MKQMNNTETLNYSWEHHFTQAPTPAAPLALLLSLLENPALQS